MNRSLPSVEAFATTEEFRDIHRATHAMWGGGLTRESYVEYWLELARTPWSRRRLEVHVLRDGRRWRSSLKLYRLETRFGDRTVPASILGSLFTPHRQRRRGHGGSLVRDVLHEVAEQGDAFTWLFSDIDTHFYRRLGFEPLPAWEAFVPIHEIRDPPAGWHWERIRGAFPRARLASIYDRWCRDRPLSIVRGDGQWTYLERRTEAFFRRLGNGSTRTALWIGGVEGEDTAYAWVTEGPAEWILREFAVADPPCRGEAWRSLLDRAHACRVGHLYGWIDSDLLQLVPGATRRRRRQALPLVRVHRSDGPDWPAMRALGRDLLGYQDQF